MMICEVCGLASHTDQCPTCGASRNDQNESGDNQNSQDNFSKEIEMPFDLEAPTKIISNVPVFGLDSSPDGDEVEDLLENNENLQFSHNIPFGLQDEPNIATEKNLIFGLQDTPDCNE
tara:strand:+ start:272 stop:625 length:354 start_codon:yes stop_codon:yes gene_type:complete